MWCGKEFSTNGFKKETWNPRYISRDSGSYNQKAIRLRCYIIENDPKYLQSILADELVDHTFWKDNQTLSPTVRLGDI